MIWVTLCGKHFKLPSPGDFHDHNSWIEDYCSKHNSIQNLFVLHFLFLKDYSLFITSVDKHKCCDVLSNCVCVCNQASASTFVFDLHFTGPDMWPLTLEGNAEFVECVCVGGFIYTHIRTHSHATLNIGQRKICGLLAGQLPLLTSLRNANVVIYILDWWQTV